MAVWRKQEVIESPSARDLVIWDRLVKSHEAFALASVEFLEETVDRVTVLRGALRGHGKHTAIWMLSSLPQSELQDLFDDLVFQASYAHGAVGTVRNAILSLPREWVISNIENVAEPLLVDGTYDEYRRLLELYALLDPALTKRLVERAIQHPDPDIQEAGRDFSR